MLPIVVELNIKWKKIDFIKMHGLGNDFVIIEITLIF